MLWNRAVAEGCWSLETRGIEAARRLVANILYSIVIMVVDEG